MILNKQISNKARTLVVMSVRGRIRPTELNIIAWTRARSYSFQCDRLTGRMLKSKSSPTKALNYVGITTWRCMHEALDLSDSLSVWRVVTSHDGTALHWLFTNPGASTIMESLHAHHLLFAGGTSDEGSLS